MIHEIKPHNKAFKSTFVEKKKDVAIITYGDKKVKVSIGKVKDKKSQAYRNQYKIGIIYNLTYSAICRNFG